MHKLILTIGIFVLSCASSGSGPHGLLFNESTLSLYSSGQKSIKQGQACAHSVLGLVAWGDASSQLVQSDYSIDKIFAIDQYSFSFFGIYAKLCTVIKGN